MTKIIKWISIVALFLSISVLISFYAVVEWHYLSPQFSFDRLILGYPEMLLSALSIFICILGKSESP